MNDLLKILYQCECTEVNNCSVILCEYIPLVRKDKKNHVGREWGWVGKRLRTNNKVNWVKY